MFWDLNYEKKPDRQMQGMSLRTWQILESEKANVPCGGPIMKGLAVMGRRLKLFIIVKCSLSVMLLFSSLLMISMKAFTIIVWSFPIDFPSPWPKGIATTWIFKLSNVVRERYRFMRICPKSSDLFLLK